LHFPVIFIEDFINRLSFMCSTPNDKNIFHTRGHNTQENVSYVNEFCFNWCSFFNFG